MTANEKIAFVIVTAAAFAVVVLDVFVWRV